MTKRVPNKRRLNDLFVKKLKPRERPFLFWDTVQRGLAVQVQPTGQKSWKVIYSFHSRPRWYHIADAAAVGLSDARKLAGQIMFKVAEGKDPQAERRAARGAGTFEDLRRAIGLIQNVKTNLGNKPIGWFGDICCRDGPSCQPPMCRVPTLRL
jgi:Arm DNA-binding domain